VVRSSAASDVYKRQLLTFMASYIKPENYLELGVRCGKNFVSVAQFCKKATGVDISPAPFGLHYNMQFIQTSTDSFFEHLDKNEMFDMVFIDADHSHEQSLKDFLNVKDRVIEDGFVFFHDTYPYDPRMFDPNLSNDCYKTALWIKQNLSEEFEIVTLPINPGVTIAKKMPKNKQLTYL
jgi:predicted O-methyltransferase YrrM